MGYLTLAMLGGWELAIVGIIGLLLFGSQLPKLARNAGKGISEFKRGLSEIDETVNKPPGEPNRPAAGGPTGPGPASSGNAPAGGAASNSTETQNPA